jgi:hypothetical protein
MSDILLNPDHPEWHGNIQSLKQGDLTTRETRKRWLSYLHYRMSDGRILRRTVEFEELSELHNIVERGPDFTAITSIEIIRTDAAVIDERFVVETFEVIQ